MRRLLKRLAAGNSLFRPSYLGPWAVAENWGGVPEVIVYGDYSYCMAVAEECDVVPTTVHRVCFICDGLEHETCDCNEPEFPNA